MKNHFLHQIPLNWPKLAKKAVLQATWGPGEAMPDPTGPSTGCQSSQRNFFMKTKPFENTGKKYFFEIFFFAKKVRPPGIEPKTTQFIRSVFISLITFDCRGVTPYFFFQSMRNLKRNIFDFCGKLQFDSFTHYIHFLLILTPKKF